MIFDGPLRDGFGAFGGGGVGGPAPLPVPGNTLFIGLSGDSSAARFLEEFSDAPSLNAGVEVTSDGINFAQLTTGSAAMKMGNALQLATGKTIRFINAAASGRTASEYIADTDSLYTSLKNKMLAAGCTAANTLLIWCLWHNDASGGTITSQSYVTTGQQTLNARIRSDLSAPGLMIMHMGVLPIGTGTTDQQARWARGGVLDLVNSDPTVRYLCNIYDLPVQDGPGHLNLAGSLTAGTRAIYQPLAWLTGGQQVRGPAFASIEAVSLTQTRFNLLYRGAANDFTPTSALTGHAISGDNFVNSMTISAAVRETASSVLITHAPLAANTRKARYMGLAFPVLTGVLIDNSAAAHSCDPTPADLSVAFAPTYGAALTPVTSTNGVDITVSGTQLTFNFTSTTASTADRQFTTITNGVYEVTFDVVSIGASPMLNRLGITQGGSTISGNAAGLTNQTISVAGPHSVTFVASGTTTWLRLRAQSTGLVIDNIRMRPVS